MSNLVLLRFSLPQPSNVRNIYNAQSIDKQAIDADDELKQAHWHGPSSYSWSCCFALVDSSAVIFERI